MNRETSGVRARGGPATKRADDAPSMGSSHHAIAALFATLAFASAGCNNQPKSGPSGPTATAVASGRSHSCALISDGSVWCWGSDEQSQLGASPDAGTGLALVPERVTLEAPAKAIAVGGVHDFQAMKDPYEFSCALLSDSTVWCWGLVVAGQQAPDGVTTTDLVRASGPLQLQFGSSSAPVAIAAGATEACALLSDGSVWCWGLGAPPKTSGRVTALPEYTTPAQVIQIPPASAIAVSPLPLVQGRSPGSVLCAVSRSLVNGDTIVWCTSTALAERTGISFASPQVQLSVGDEWCMLYGEAKVAELQVSCWAPTGQSQTLAPRAPVKPVVEGVAISAGVGDTCVIAPNAGVICWGDNTYGELGGGTEVDGGPTFIPGLNDVTGISVGDEHVCAVAGGNVWCWGDNSWGQLGNGTVTGAYEPTLVVPAWQVGSQPDVDASASSDSSADSTTSMDSSTSPESSTDSGPHSGMDSSSTAMDSSADSATSMDSSTSPESSTSTDSGPDSGADAGTCTLPIVTCGGQTVDPCTNETYCGASGNCMGLNEGINCTAFGAQCVAGVCQCPPGQQVISGYCQSCSSPSIVCGQQCVDPSTNPSYCGATGDCQGANAGANCTSGTCTSGVCTCPAGQVSCGGVCVDPTTSTTNCGASGNCQGANAGTSCAQDYTCNAGACVACSTISNGAPMVTTNQVPQAPPSPAGGGAPPDGIYYLTSEIDYTGSGGASGPFGTALQDTIQISNSGATVQEVWSQTGSAGSDTATYSWGSSTVTITATCPANAGPFIWGYTTDTSTPATFHLFNGATVTTYTMQ